MFVCFFFLIFSLDISIEFLVIFFLKTILSAADDGWCCFYYRIYSHRNTMLGSIIRQYGIVTLLLCLFFQLLCLFVSTISMCFTHCMGIKFECVGNQRGIQRKNKTTTTRELVPWSLICLKTRNQFTALCSSFSHFRVGLIVVFHLENHLFRLYVFFSVVSSSICCCCCCCYSWHMVTLSTLNVCVFFSAYIFTFE